jgi:hypothetical protein
VTWRWHPPRNFSRVKGGPHWTPKPNASRTNNVRSSPGSPANVRAPWHRKVHLTWKFGTSPFVILDFYFRRGGSNPTIEPVKILGSRYPMTSHATRANLRSKEPARAAPAFAGGIRGSRHSPAQLFHDNLKHESTLSFLAPSSCIASLARRKTSSIRMQS